MPNLAVHCNPDDKNAIESKVNSLRADKDSRFFERTRSYVYRVLIQEGLDREKKSFPRRRSKKDTSGT